MKVVLAGNAAQYDQWCEENKLAPHSREAVAIANRDSIRGMSFAPEDLVCVGTWFHRDDLPQIINELRFTSR